MTDWAQVQVSSLAAPTPNALATGPFGSAVGQKQFRTEGVPLIRGSNLSTHIGTRLNDEGLVFVDQALADQFPRSVARHGDLIFTCWGTVGQVGYVDQRASHPAYLVSNKQMKFTPDEGQADGLFLYYWFSSPAGQAAISAVSIGSSVPGFNLGQLRQIAIPLPPLREQRRIVEVLGALDDKIDLNRRMNATLEAMARAIFRDWFVDFGPTRAKMEGRAPYLAPEVWSLFPDALGDDGLPVGWHTRSVYEFANVIYGAPFASARFNADRRGLPLIRIRDLATHDPQVFTDENHPKGETVRAGDLVAGMDGEFRLHVWRGPNALLNQRVCKFAPKAGIASAFLAEALREPLAFFERGKVGTTVVHLGKADIDTIHLLKAPSTVMKTFGDAAEPLIARVVTNAAEARTLAALRDLLLPRLLSGELRIRDAEAVVEAAQ